MTEPLTDEQIRTLGSRLAGVCDGAVDEAAEWIAPVVARMVAEAADAREAEVRARVERLADTWQADLDSGGIQDANARYCWGVALHELRAALAPADNDGEARNG